MTYSDPFARPPDHEPTPGWGQSLARGAAGIALLHAEYARAGVGDWETAHRWAAAAARGPVAGHRAASLFHGAPAVAFTLRTLQRAAGTNVYLGPLAALDRHIAALTRQRLHRAHERIDAGQLPELREFDLINGLTGIGVYLLHTRHTELLHEVLAYLVRLADPLTVDGRQMPGWWTHNGPADQPSPDWPGGHANLGLAHGIAGPLALLATAARHGLTVPGHHEAIDRIDTWLGYRRQGTASRPWWPGLLSRSDDANWTVTAPGPQRPSWCYGTPGLARARQLAALALDDHHRQRQAEHDLAACVTDDTQLAQLRTGGLCHGWAGLVHTTTWAAADAGPDSELAAVLPRLHHQWVQHRRQHDPALSDQPGMLDGAVGITLALHATVPIGPDRDSGARTSLWWDACLLTAPPVLPTPHLEGIE